MQIIPYNPQTDPRQYLAQALQQGASTYLGQRQRQQFQKGLSPTMTPIQLLQKALTAGLPMQQALGVSKLGTQGGQEMGQMPWWMRGARPEAISTYRERQLAPDETKIEKLRYKDAKGKMKIWRGSAEDLPEIVDQIIEAGGTIDTTKSTLSDERLRLYQEAKARGDEKAAELALYGKPLVEVQFGQKLLTSDQRQDIAEADYEKKIQPTVSELGMARKSVTNIIGELPQRFFKWGKKNYTKDNLTEAYKHYQMVNNYANKSKKKQQQLDKIWDTTIAHFNKVGYKDPDTKKSIGKNEFDWNPKDDKVKQLRKNPVKENIVQSAQAEPQNQEEFIRTVQSIEDKAEAEAYYNKWVSKWQ